MCCDHHHSQLRDAPDAPVAFYHTITKEEMFLRRPKKSWTESTITMIKEALCTNQVVSPGWKEMTCEMSSEESWMILPVCANNEKVDASGCLSERVKDAITRQTDNIGMR